MLLTSFPNMTIAKSGTPCLSRICFCDIRITRCDSKFVGRPSFRSCNEDLRSISVAKEADRFEGASLHAAPKDDDGIGLRKWVVNNPSLCNSCEKRRVEEPGERSESNNTDRAFNAIAKPPGAGFRCQMSGGDAAETPMRPLRVRFREDLDVYKKAYTLAMRVLEMSRSFDASRKCTATDVSDRKS